MQGKKPGGRVAGTPNRITIELRKTLKTVVASELESFAESALVGTRRAYARVGEIPMSNLR